MTGLVYFLWAMVLVITAIFEANGNFLIVFLLWLIVLASILLFVGFEFSEKSVISKTLKFFYGAPQFKNHLWAHLLLLTLPLFFIGGPVGNIGNHKWVYSIKSPFGSRVVVPNKVSLHIPWIETVDIWENPLSFSGQGGVAQTKDGHKITFHYSIQASINKDRIPEVIDRFGSFSNGYTLAVQRAVVKEIQQSVQAYTLEELSSKGALILEDHVGTNTGLEDVGLEWSGTIAVYNIHATVGTLTP